MMMKKDLLILSLAISLCFPVFVFAENVILKSGKKIEGKITEKTDKYIKVDILGMPITYLSTEIESIDGQGISLPTAKEQPLPQNVAQPQSDQTSKTEYKFKELCKEIAKEFAETSSKEQQKRLFYRWQDELRNLIKSDPKSIWADDAQYIISMLNAANPKQESLELEYLLKGYPDMHLEDWTRENLVFITPNPNLVFDYVVRISLCFDYQKLGETNKLKQMCEESIKKYPDKAKIFEKFLRGEVSLQ